MGVTAGAAGNRLRIAANAMTSTAPVVGHHSMAVSVTLREVCRNSVRTELEINSPPVGPVYINQHPYEV